MNSVLRVLETSNNIPYVFFYFLLVFSHHIWIEWGVHLVVCWYCSCSSEADYEDFEMVEHDEIIYSDCCSEENGKKKL